MGMGQIVDYSQFILQIEKAIANGVATLDSNAKVPKNQIALVASDVGAIAVESDPTVSSFTKGLSSNDAVLTAVNNSSGTISASRLPSYVDDVLEFATLAGFPGTGETGKIYVAQNTNKTYRWTGSVYVEISSAATADEALKLTIPRTISITGDATYSVSFDGSANVSGGIILANSGVTAGTYNNSATQVRPFAVDAKGRITGVGTPVDITPPWSAITGKPTTLNGYGITDALNLAGGNVTGNLGLGVSSPTVKLSIGRLGGVFSVPTLNSNTAALITAGGGVAASGSFLSILGGNTSQVAVTFGDSDAAEQGGIYYNNSTDTLDLRAGNSNRISISSGTTTFSSTTTSTSTTTGAICAASLGITGAIFADSVNATSKITVGQNFSISSISGYSNISLGNNLNSEYGQSSIEIPTNTLYGGGYQHHTGIKLVCGEMSEWGTAKFKIHVSNNWGTYNPIPCFSVGDVGGTFLGSVKATSFSVGNNQVVSSRRTGWGVPTGTATRTTFETSTVTLSQLAERVKALIDDLTTHGLIGV